MSSRQAIAAGNGRLKLNLDSVVKFSPPLTSKNCEQDSENMPYSQPQSTEAKHLTYVLSPPLPQKQSTAKFENHSLTNRYSKPIVHTSQPSYKYDFPRRPSIGKHSPFSSNAYVNLPTNEEIKGENGNVSAHSFVVPRQLYINEKPVSYDIPKERANTNNSKSHLKDATRASPPQKLTLHHVPDLSKVYVDVNYQVVDSSEQSLSQPKSRATFNPSEIAESLQYLDVVDSKRVKSCHRSYQTLPTNRLKTKSISNGAKSKGEERQSPISLYDKPRHGIPRESSSNLSPVLTSLGQEEDIMTQFKSTPLGKMEVKSEGKERVDDMKGSSSSIIAKVLKRFTSNQRGHPMQKERNDDFNKAATPTLAHVPTSCCLLKRLTRRRSKKESLHPCPKHSLKRVDSGKRAQKFSVRTKVAMPSFTHFTKKNKVKRCLVKETSSPTPPSSINDGIIKKIMGRLSYHEIDLEKTEALRKMMLLSNIN